MELEDLGQDGRHLVGLALPWPWYAFAVQGRRSILAIAVQNLKVGPGCMSKHRASIQYQDLVLQKVQDREQFRLKFAFIPSYRSSYHHVPAFDVASCDHSECAYAEAAYIPYIK